MVVNVMPLDNGAPALNAQQTRQIWSSFLGPAPAGRQLGAFSGVRPGTPSTTVFLSGSGSMTWNVNTHSGVIDAETATSGPYLYAAFTNSGTITAADATNPRIDTVYVEIDDGSQGDGSGAEAGVVGYVAGTAAASPTAPNPPHLTRSIVLANISVPASGSGAPTVTWVAPIFGQLGALLANKSIAGDQSVPDSTWTTVAWPNVTASNGIVYGGSSGLWTVPRDAWYTVSAVAEFAANATGTRYLRLMAPTAAVRWNDNPTSSQVCTVGGSISLFIPANTNIYVQAYQSSGSSLAIRGDANLGSYISILES